MTITIVYEEPEQLSKLNKSDKVDWVFLDENNFKQRRKARLLKAHWATRLTPFAEIKDNETNISVYYSETDDVIKCINNFVDSL